MSPTGVQGGLPGRENILCPGDIGIIRNTAVPAS
jgi:hypothetical protein